MNEQINEKIVELVEKIGSLEDELQTMLHEQRDQVLYHLVGRKVAFEQTIRGAHRKVRIGVLRWLRESQLRNLLSAPFIYGMFIPFVLFDICITLYQWACFPLYRIPLVRRSDFIVIDRHQLDYLNVIEKLNCVYCGYGNGLLSYSVEIAGRTEQYWCPIKHARRVARRHGRYARFLDYGDAEGYARQLDDLRGELRRIGKPG